MSLISYLRQAKLGWKQSKKRRGSRRNSKNVLGFENLESRQMLAGIFLDTANSDLIIFGDEANDSGRIDIVGGQYRAQIQGAETQSFPTSQVSRVTFIGGLGNDTFVNATPLTSFIYGNAGNDTLTGGTGVDNIFGDIGNDTIDGRGGDDVIIGDLGDDTISGGDGNDRISTGDGTNVANGENGDDDIFGGSGVDTINGGAGIDGIFPQDGNNIINTGTGGVFAASANFITQSDLVVSGNGNDRVTAGGGWDSVFSAGGNDVLLGSASGVNWLFGMDGNDTLTGGNQADTLRGGEGDDVINGLGGDDTIHGEGGVDTINAGNGADNINGGSGNDIINGQGGADIAFYGAGVGSYKIIGETNALRVAGSSDGSDNVNAVSFLSFNGTAVEAKPNRGETVTIQPIIVSNSNGSNTSNFFGTAAQENEVKLQVDDIFHSSNVDVNWLSERSWNNSYANVGTGGTRGLLNELDGIVSRADSAGVTHSNDKVLNMYFIAKPLGTNGSNVPLGFSYFNSPEFAVGNGISIHITDSFLDGDQNLGSVGLVSAHEIAHNLGLDHTGNSNNLMYDGPIQSATLTAAQRATVRASEFSV